MNEYTPDTWVIVKITSEASGEVYKVLAGWSGSYLNGASWKLNSGITKIVATGNYWQVHGYSQSVYFCHCSREQLSPYAAEVLASFEEQLKDVGAEIKIVPIAEAVEALL